MYSRKFVRSVLSLAICAIVLTTSVAFVMPDQAYAAQKAFNVVAQKGPTVIRAKKSTKAKVAKKLPAGKVFAVTNAGGDWYAYKYSVGGKKKTGYVQKKHASKKVTGREFTAIVTAKKTPLYSKGSTATKKLRTFNAGSAIKVKPYSASWCRYTYTSGGKKKTGYVQKKYLESRVSGTAFNGMILKKISAFSKPSTYASKVKTLNVGTVVGAASYSKNWYRCTYTEGGKKKAAFVQKSAVGVAGETIYNLTLTQALDAQCQGARSSLNGRYPNSAKNPLTRNEVKKYLDPKSFGNDSYEYLQFLVLNTFDGVTGAQLNKTVLSTCTGSSSLKNKGDAFVASAKKYNINAVYLASHARLESGSGMSNLSMGVYYSEQENNALTRTEFIAARDKGTKPTHKESKMPKDFTTYKIYYNHFGYGAADSGPLLGGAKWAKSKGWTTSEKAIDGCAQTISANYFNARNQTTLYKMRWNPAAMVTYKSTKGIGSQYATDISWACKIANIMGAAYGTIGLSNSHVDVPVYK